MSASRPRTDRLTSDALNECIRGLNDDYGLDIRPPGPALANSKHKDEEDRIREIHGRVMKMHYSANAQLNHVLHTFRREAQRLLERMDSAPLGARPTPSDTERAALQDCLLKCLRDGEFLQKRKFLQSPQTSNGERAYISKIDAIPVRSSPGSGCMVSDPITVDDSDYEVLPDAPDSRNTSFTSVFTNASTRTTQVSSTSGSFMVVNNETPATTQNSLQSNATDSLALSYRRQSSDEGVLQNSILGVGSHLTQSFEEKDRFENIWPKSPSLVSDHVPLAILYEVTRAGLHCDVDLSKVKLPYEPNESWHNPLKIKETIKSLPAFQGKALPPPNDPEVWKAALNGFQVGNQIVTLAVALKYRPDAPGPLFSVIMSPLQKLEVGYRLARRFGADRFLEVNLEILKDARSGPKILQGANGFDKVTKWLIHDRHYFLGRLWKAFFMRKADKPDKRFQIFFFATDGDSFRIPMKIGEPPPPDEARNPQRRTKCDVDGLLRWTLNMQKNMEKQPPLKLFCRIELSLSKTWPAVVLEPHQFRHRSADLGSKMVMNDGLARMSPSLAAKVASSLSLSEVPSAFQARIGSAKGMWMVDIEDDGQEDWLETYPSQRKFECDFLDVQHRTFEVKTWSRKPTSASINEQLIIILDNQALDKQALRHVLSKHMVAHIRTQLDADNVALSHPDECRLWLQPELIWNKRQAADYVSFLGGLPQRDALTAAFLLDSGFDPKKLEFLKDKIMKIKKSRTQILRSKLNFVIPQSANLLMLADFTGSLEEGQIYVSLATEFDVEDYQSSVLDDMDVLVSRTPAHYPSDIQKVRAVYTKALRKLRGVVVFSTKGERPLADMLSGGDYDGDRAWICWDPEIVSNFHSVDTPQSLDPLGGFMTKSTLNFRQLKLPRDNTTFCQRFLYEAFKFTTQENLLGICTSFKDDFSYHERLSISDQRVVNLSRLLSELVDLVKQGRIFTWKNWNEFRKQVLLSNSNGYRAALYKSDKSDDQPYIWTTSKSDHILDYLRFEVVNPVTKAVIANTDRSLECNQTQTFDEDLTFVLRSFEAMTQRSEFYKILLKQLNKDITHVADQWTNSMNPVEKDFQPRVLAVYRQWMDILPSKEALSCPELQSRLVLLDTDWDEDYNTTMWTLLKASATFSKFHKKTTFVWQTAGRQLAILKGLRQAVSPLAQAPAVLVAPHMWAVLQANKKLIRTLSAQRSGEVDDGASVLSEAEQVNEDYVDDIM